MQMNNEEKIKNDLLKKITSIKTKLVLKLIKKLRIEMMERCVKRMISFSGECEECKELMIKTDKILEQTSKHLNSLNHKVYKDHYGCLQKSVVHLQRKHKLVKPNHHTEMWMGLGIALGLPLGMAIFDNIALGLPIGLAIGLAIGSGLDAHAKKKGKVI